MDEMEYEEREAQLVKEVAEWIAVVEKLKTEQEQYKNKVREAIEKDYELLIDIVFWCKTKKEFSKILVEKHKEKILEELGLKGE